MRNAIRVFAPNKSVSHHAGLLHHLSIVLFLLLPMDALNLSATVAVGTCLPQLKSFSTIQAAVSASSPEESDQNEGNDGGKTVLVCPGTYPEQVVINTPLTLKGVVSGNHGAAVILCLHPASFQMALLAAEQQSPKCLFRLLAAP